MNIIKWPLAKLITVLLCFFMGPPKITFLFTITFPCVVQLFRAMIYDELENNFVYSTVIILTYNSILRSIKI